MKVEQFLFFWINRPIYGLNPLLDYFIRFLFFSLFIHQDVSPQNLAISSLHPTRATYFFFFSLSLSSSSKRIRRPLLLLRPIHPGLISILSSAPLLPPPSFTSSFHSYFHHLDLIFLAFSTKCVLLSLSLSSSPQWSSPVILSLLWIFSGHLTIPLTALR